MFSFRQRLYVGFSRCESLCRSTKCKFIHGVKSCHSGTILGKYFLILLEGLIEVLSLLCDIDLPYMVSCCLISSENVPLAQLPTIVLLQSEYSIY